MTEDEKEVIDDRSHVMFVEHIVIRDRQNGEVLLAKRDTTAFQIAEDRVDADDNKNPD